MEIKSTVLSNGVTYGNVDFKCELESKDNNNCSVRALATAFEIPYKKAFDGAEMIWDRKINKGASCFGVHKMANMGWLWDKQITKMGEVIVDTFNNDYPVTLFAGEKKLGKWYPIGGGEKKFRKMSTGTFFKTYNKGTFIVSVTGHMFTVKDGEVLGNYSDATMLKRPIDVAFAVGREANKVIKPKRIKGKRVR